MKIDFSGVNKRLPQIYRVKKYLTGFGVVAAIIGIATLFILISEDEGANSRIEEARKEIDVSHVTKKVKAEDRWIEKSENQLIELNKSQEQLRQENLSLRNKIEQLEGSMSQRIKDIEAKSNLSEIKKYIEEAAKERSKDAALTMASDEIGEMRQGSEKRGVISQDQFEVTKKIMSYDIDLEGGFKGYEHNKDLRVYLPAGSYVDAELISGVDASVGVESQSDPRPVLFRITARAVNALYEGKPQKIDLEGCTVTGAASGDLSSERVFVRLLKMSCSREEERAFENDVEGYVSSKGKAGIRGIVVSREGDFVSKSFFAGLIGGIGGGVSQRFSTPDTILKVGDSGGNSKQSYQDILGRGFGRGTEVASNKVSDYLIKRAEQYQPVVSVGSGQSVELVFNNGVYLDGRK